MIVLSFLCLEKIRQTQFLCSAPESVLGMVNVSAHGDPRFKPRVEPRHERRAFI